MDSPAPAPNASAGSDGSIGSLYSDDRGGDGDDDDEGGG